MGNYRRASQGINPVSQNWIEQLRENKLMRNDDVTLMILEVQGEC